MLNLRKTLALGGVFKRNARGIQFIYGDIETATTLDPFTHIYMFDLAFPPELQKDIAKKFNLSVHAISIVSFCNETKIISTFGYDVFLADKVITKMHGKKIINKCMYCFIISSILFTDYLIQ